ncbi:hypothetical protein A5888_003467 [Enterococcus sp. 9E7_DIV0242]|uniref:Zinc-ribbon 15 domain-containing protein n=1 Tax=Candidatus Enterococcus clewellii TaxID=1834193 RepID=A0A242K2H1_9ENTE|nr:hypothetical protein A5888_003761 [Enterococcus sp. 9E7_DIV0242]
MFKFKRIKVALGDTSIRRKCAQCKNSVTFKAHRIEKKFILFEKPLFTLNTVSYIFCPDCDLKREIAGKKLKKYLAGDICVLRL